MSGSTAVRDVTLPSRFGGLPLRRDLFALLSAIEFRADLTDQKEHCFPPCLSGVR
jgi:hypothetical protein